MLYFQLSYSHQSNSTKAQKSASAQVFGNSVPVENLVYLTKITINPVLSNALLIVDTCSRYIK